MNERKSKFVFNSLWEIKVECGSPTFDREDAKGKICSGGILKGIFIIVIFKF